LEVKGRKRVNQGEGRMGKGRRATRYCKVKVLLGQGSKILAASMIGAQESMSAMQFEEGRERVHADMFKVRIPA